ncbi:sulfotransferase domain-containing protein [Jannaschia ovalis]|uniref:Sulfotransferase n=1 Tax=Jannaschia ovalis TaxID=3038773 RepID=A0ABY8LC74_9RHOB|nr:sulfotransferase domain-containing protein [Jannaschia sp. GRR-S6-38]WGH78926.1 sulfotransferase [Jannaschia sp. GRR-S6-38]
MRPDQATFIGIGAQKCASTWLYGVLAQCPDLRVSDEKEVDFFSYRFDRGYEWYERRFVSGRPRRHRGEISPSYFIHPAAPDRAAAYNPDLQILVCLRDPVARAFSNHLHEVRKGHVSGANVAFEAALDNNPLYVDQGRYATHLSRWFDAFPRARIHVLFQEEIRADRAAAARRVTDALGLPPIADFLDRRANESVRYRNPVLGRTLWRLGHAARRAGLGRAVETAKALPGIREMRDANRERLREVVAPMRPDTEARLTAMFAPEVERLETLLGRETPWPRFRPAAAGVA